ncbi:transposase [Glycomyces xiaoerkulensis]|uniref:transposase n=1 Tax=Glycomyces xiaoerkulensis TaxID=2038139 RepID=UPI0038CBF9C1
MTSGSKYTDEFKADAVRLYVNDPDSSYVTTAQALGISPNTLKNWVRKASAGKLTADAAGQSSNPTLDVASQAVIEAENRRLKAEVARLREERDILRKASAVLLRATD